MTRFYYFDTYGEKQGPIDSQQLKGLVAQGLVRQETQLETESGQRGQARQIAGLFPKQVSVVSVAAFSPKDDMDEDEVASRIKSDENAAKIILTMLWILGIFVLLSGLCFWFFVASPEHNRALEVSRRATEEADRAVKEKAEASEAKAAAESARALSSARAEEARREIRKLLGAHELDSKENDLVLREEQLEKREQELSAKETEFARREQLLAEREKALEERAKQSPDMSNESQTE